MTPSTAASASEKRRPGAATLRKPREALVADRLDFRVDHLDESGERLLVRGALGADQVPCQLRDGLVMVAALAAPKAEDPNAINLSVVL
jgi:hypothetical protein